MKRRMTAMLALAFLVALVCACGDDEESAPPIEMTPRQATLSADGDTAIEIRLNEPVETDIDLATDVGFVGLGGQKTDTWQTSMGMLDAPFECGGETGTATVTATWTARDITESTEIVCQ